jgi:general stress protein 26
MPPRVEHVRGLDALPLVERALSRFEPAVLLTADGLGAIHASGLSDGPGPHTLWFLADARALLEWESHRRQIVTLSFQSPDERIFLTLSGRTEVVTDPPTVSRLWRPTFRRWFSGGAGDPRLLLVRFAPYDAEFYEATTGRVTAHVAP